MPDSYSEEDRKDLPDLTPEQEARMWRKIDLRLLPILGSMYCMSFLDRGASVVLVSFDYCYSLRGGWKGNIGNARLQGLEADLGLVGNQYNIALTMFFIPYCIFECPSNLILKRARPRIWLPGITVVWGTVMTVMGLVKNYPQLVTCRVFLGIAEAGLFPGVIYHFTIWYPRHMLQLRIGLFYGTAALSGAFSGLLAFGISYMSGTGGFNGWRWIFILEGLGTVIVGLVGFLVLVDFPDTAGFLTPEERDYVIRRNKYDNFGVGEEERFSVKYIIQAFTDWQVGDLAVAKEIARARLT
ncbi:hypothetical protein PQX77_008653 [Marasmius sp. AFHP31]|nr:hypothetical protein PQX77_008653 [Marasmius sp. AFHP31]